MRSAILSCCGCLLAACASSDFCRRIESGDVHVEFAQVASLTDRTYATRVSWGAAMRDVLGSGGAYRSHAMAHIDASAFLCARGSLWAEYPEDVIDDYVRDHADARLERGWSEVDGETLCRLYDVKGRKDLLLCQLYATPQPAPSKASTVGVTIVEQRPDALQVGVRCPQHGEWMLLFLLPPELENCASHVLERVIAMGEARVLWCEAGHHAVAPPDSE